MPTDKERIDFIDRLLIKEGDGVSIRKGSRADLPDCIEQIFVEIFTTPSQHQYGETAREVIDIAMKYESGKRKRNFGEPIPELQKAFRKTNKAMLKAAVHPREVVKKALLLGANAIILCHNHPSGNPKPSNEDIKITKIIKDGCKLLEINVLDHIIIANDSYYSFMESGIL